MKYFRVLADPKSIGRWIMDEPVAASRDSIDARDFTVSRPYSGPEPVIVTIQREGIRLPFNFAAFDMPVVSEQLATELKEISATEVVFYPVLVDSTIQGYEIMNVLSALKCLDENKSEILRWKTEDGRPDRVGQYRMVINISIDPTLARGRHIFRVLGWEVALIVSDVVRNRLLKLGGLGVVFEPV